MLKNRDRRACWVRQDWMSIAGEKEFWAMMCRGGVVVDRS